MSQSLDAPLLATAGGKFGYLLGGFIMPMVPALVLLVIAGAKNRNPNTAKFLRISAIAITLILEFASYRGSGGMINFGGILAIATTSFLVYRQNSKKSS